MLRHLKGLFAAFVVVGVIVIFALSTGIGARSGDSARASSQLIGIVVGLMFVYGILLSIRSHLGIASEGDGETFYYLGFIFTLATLVATFMPLLWETTKVDSKQVLGLFGLGLITTFVGLAGRIFFSQFAGPLDHGEEPLRRLAEAADEARRNIESCGQQISRAADTIAEDSRVAHARMASDFEARSSAFSSELKKLAEQAGRSVQDVGTISVKRITELMNSLEQRLNSIQLPPKEAGEQLSAEIQATVARLKTFSAGVDESAGKTREAALRFSETSTAAIQAKGHIESLGGAAQAAAAATHSAAEALNRSKEAFDQVSKRIDGLGISVTQSQGTIGQAVTSITQDLERGRAAWITFVEASGSLRDRVQQFANSAQELANLVSTVSRAVAEAQKASQLFAESTRELSEAARSGSDVAKEMIVANSEASQTLARLIAVANQHHSQLVQLVNRIEADVAASHEAVNKVHQQLVTSASFIVNKLG